MKVSYGVASGRPGMQSAIKLKSRKKKRNSHKPTSTKSPVYIQQTNGLSPQLNSCVKKRTPSTVTPYTPHETNREAITQQYSQQSAPLPLQTTLQIHVIRGKRSKSRKLILVSFYSYPWIRNSKNTVVPKQNRHINLCFQNIKKSMTAVVWAKPLHKDVNMNPKTPTLCAPPPPLESGATTFCQLENSNGGRHDIQKDLTLVPFARAIMIVPKRNCRAEEKANKKNTRQRWKTANLLRAATVVQLHGSWLLPSPVVDLVFFHCLRRCSSISSKKILPAQQTQRW